MKAKGQLKCCSAGTVHRATGRKGHCGRPEPNRVRAGGLCAVSFARSSQNPFTPRRSSKCRGLSLLQEFFICGFPPSLPASCAAGHVAVGLRFVLASFRIGAFICGLAGPASGTWGEFSTPPPSTRLCLVQPCPSSPRPLPPGVKWRQLLLVRQNACFKLKQLPGVVAEMSSNELSPALGL